MVFLVLQPKVLERFRISLTSMRRTVVTPAVSLCGVSLATHFGKPGPGNCLGMAVTKFFADWFSSVQETRALLLQGRSAAANHEARLKKGVAALTKQLGNSE